LFAFESGDSAVSSEEVFFAKADVVVDEHLIPLLHIMQAYVSLLRTNFPSIGKAILDVQERV
jgi:hypothetical protein